MNIIVTKKHFLVFLIIECLVESGKYDQKFSNFMLCIFQQIPIYLVFHFECKEKLRTSRN